MTTTKTKVTIVDPPSGWRYGFPKPLPEGQIDDEAWYLEQGYPPWLIDQGMLKYVRYWETEADNDDF